MKKLGCCFAGLAVVLSWFMCKTVKNHYDQMLAGIEKQGYSAPAQVAFLSGIPYLIGIVICVVFAIYFIKKR